MTEEEIAKLREWAMQQDPSQLFTNREILDANSIPLSFDNSVALGDIFRGFGWVSKRSPDMVTWRRFK